jgi:hypothetical protein
LPHDTQAFTEGLTIYNNKVYESTRQTGSYRIAEVDPGSGVHTKKVTLDSRYFGEGMTILNDKVFYLTWQTKIGFVYDLKTYKQIGEFHYDSEGWGLTHNNKELIMSAGTEKLYFLDTANLKVVRTLTVTDESGKVKNLNELEFIDGFIFANVRHGGQVIRLPEGGWSWIFLLSPMKSTYVSQYAGTQWNCIRQELEGHPCHGKVLAKKFHVRLTLSAYSWLWWVLKTILRKAIRFESSLFEAPETNIMMMKFSSGGSAGPETPNQ